MNSTLGLALSMLKKQRRGSALLLSTVILSSVFLVCMCIVGASSVYTVEESRKDLYGSHKAAIWGVAEEEQNLEDFLERFPVWNAHGVAESYAAFEGIDGRSHLLGNLDESALELLRVELVSGRMPQTENEAVFEESMARQLGLDSINVGDSVTLELTDALGERYNAAFTVCGIIKNYSAVKNNTLDPGANNAFYPSVLVSSRDLPDVLTLHLLDSDVEDFRVLRPCLPPSEGGEFNTDAYPGGYSSSVFYVSEEVGLTFSALGLLGGIILVCTATVTLNGFLMSVDRRKQQMSLMRCIGATKRQAKKVVFCEAMILLILGIPAGLALGSGLSFFAVKLFGELSQTEMLWSFAWWPLPLAAALCFACVMLSTLIPAHKAAKQPPIVAARPVFSSPKGKRKEGSPVGVMGMAAISVKITLGRTLMTGLVFSLIIVVAGVSALFLKTLGDTGYSVPDVKIRPASNSISYEGEEGKMMHSPFYINYEALKKYLSIPLELPVLANEELPLAFSWCYVEPRFAVSIDKDSFDQYLNGYFIYDAEKLPINRDNFSEEEIIGIPTGKYPYLSSQVSYGIPEDRYLLETYVFSVSDELLQRLQANVTSGKIDVDAIRRGDEVVLALPNYEIDYSNYPYGQSSSILGTGDNAPYIEGVVYKNENHRAGDKLTITWVNIDEDGNPQLHEKEVTVGATVTEGLSAYGMPAQVFGLYVGADTLDKMGAPHSVREMSLYFPDGVDVQETEKEVLNWLGNNFPSVQTKTLTEVNIAEQQERRLVLGIMGMMISCLASLGILGLVNTASARINSRSHQLGRLRCMGMTKGQILLMLILEGGSIGIGAAIFGTGICRVLLPLMTQGWRFTEVWTSSVLAALAAILLSVVTVCLPALKILKKSPTEITLSPE